MFFFFFFFFVLRTWSTATRGDLTLLRKPPDYTHKPAPFNESDDSFKEKLHPFKPVEPISQRDAGKKKKPVYLQFTANANRKDKSGTCASYYECTLLCVMSAACIIQGGRRGCHISAHYIFNIQALKKGGGNQRDALSKQPENFFWQSATFSSKIVDITEINMQLLVWGRRSSRSRNRAAVRCRDGYQIGPTDYWDFRHTNTLISSGSDKKRIGLSACVRLHARVCMAL